jgi:hypothetical protein
VWELKKGASFKARHFYKNKRHKGFVGALIFGYFVGIVFSE